MDALILGLEFEKTRVFCQSDLISPGYMNLIELHGSNGSLFTSILSCLPFRLFLKNPAGNFEAGEHIKYFPEENIIKAELEYFLKGVREKKAEMNSILGSIKIVECLEKMR